MSTSNNFNLAELAQKVFGVTGVRFAIPDSPSTADYEQGGYDASSIQIIPAPTTTITSVLGTPIFEQITLTIPAVVANGAVTTPQQTYTFPGWPLFDIVGSKNIVKTSLQGKNGTIKEYISNDDFVITIRGFLINDDESAYPEQDLQDLLPVLEASTSLGITSQVFNLLNIHNIVITRYTLPALEGFPNMQPFEIEAISDEPVELEIKSVKTRQPIIAGL